MEKINILFYNTMWKAPLLFKRDDLLPRYSIPTDRRQLPYANVVGFHLLNLCSCMNEDKIIKQRGQIWVAWHLECEENYPWMKNKEFRDYFDLWMGHHLNDDIIYFYFQANYEKKLKTHLYVYVKIKYVCSSPEISIKVIGWNIWPN